ncbi:hypothetical protein [Geobacter sp. SVR]|nr:hypothetical protein [Geobacter sp. SVR]
MVTAVHEYGTFPREQLEAYLTSCRTKTCIICCNPDLFYQNTFNFPPAASKHYESLIPLEVRKALPDLQDFTFFHRIVGEATVDGVIMNKVAVFSYTDESLSESISLFNRCGKTISTIYAAPYPIFRLAAASCPDDPDTTRLIVASLPNEKMILLSLQGELAFIRKIPSSDAELRSADIHNINMTIDYCFQSLRVRPSEALLVNLCEPSSEPSGTVGIPLRVSPLPSLAAISPELAESYIAPLAAALHHTIAPALSDITPPEYTAFKIEKTHYTIAIAVMVLLSVLLGCLAYTQRTAITDLKSAIGTTRGQLVRADKELAAYRTLESEAKQCGRPIESLNRLCAAINPAAALATLSRFNSPACTLRQVATQKGDGFIGLHLEGDFRSGNLGETQRAYEEALARLVRIPGYSIASSSLDINKKSFVIEARFNGGTGQSK